MGIGAELFKVVAVELCDGGPPIMRTMTPKIIIPPQISHKLGNWVLFRGGLTFAAFVGATVEGGGASACPQDWQNAAFSPRTEPQRWQYIGYAPKFFAAHCKPHDYNRILQLPVIRAPGGE